MITSRRWQDQRLLDGAGMINVIDRRCHEPDCKKFPSHNFPGSHKKLFCATHKKEGMVSGALQTRLTFCW